MCTLPCVPPHYLLIKAPRSLAQSCLCREVSAVNTSDCIILPLVSSSQEMLLEPWWMFPNVTFTFSSTKISHMKTVPRNAKMNNSQECYSHNNSHKSKRHPWYGNTLSQGIPPQQLLSPYLTILHLSKEIPLHSSIWMCQVCSHQRRVLPVPNTSTSSEISYLLLRFSLNSMKVTYSA